MIYPSVELGVVYETYGHQRVQIIQEIDHVRGRLFLGDNHQLYNQDGQTFPYHPERARFPGGCQTDLRSPAGVHGAYLLFMGADSRTWSPASQQYKMCSDDLVTLKDAAERYTHIWPFVEILQREDMRVVSRKHYSDDWEDVIRDPSTDPSDEPDDASS